MTGEGRGYEPPEVLDIETVSRAAQEIVSLYGFFTNPKKVKVPVLSAQYVKDLLADPSQSYIHNMVILPSFPPVLLLDKKIFLEPVWEGNTGKVQYPYYLESRNSDGIVIGKTGWDSIAGKFTEAPQAYIAQGDVVYKATSLKEPKNVWENPFGVVDLQNKTRLVGVPKTLRKLITSVREYR